MHGSRPTNHRTTNPVGFASLNPPYRTCKAATSGRGFGGRFRLRLLNAFRGPTRPLAAALHRLCVGLVFRCPFPPAFRTTPSGPRAGVRGLAAQIIPALRTPAAFDADTAAEDEGAGDEKLEDGGVEDRIDREAGPSQQIGNGIIAKPNQNTRCPGVRYHAG